MNERTANGMIAGIALTVALACTALWSLLGLDCGTGSCVEPRPNLLTIGLLAGALAGWVSAAVFGLNALWGKPVSRERLGFPASAGVVVFICFTLQIIVWAR